MTLREPVQPEDRGADPHRQDAATSPRTASPSHWGYKQGRDGFAEPGRSYRLGRRTLLEILENSVTGEEFLENTKLELYQDQVFCFHARRAELIQLPRGATPVDFAYAVHSPGGRHLQSAPRSTGACMPLRHGAAERRPGGDHDRPRRHPQPGLGALRRHRQGPRPPSAATSRSSSSGSNHIDSGRAALAKAFRQEGVDGSEKVVETALKSVKAATAG